MRDGVYKSLPMPRPYKDLARACEREAERGDVARRLAAKAIEYDIRNELPSGFLTRLSRMADEVGTGLPGVSALAACGGSRDAGGRNGALANDGVTHAQRLALDGYSGRELVGRALAEGARDRLDSRIRQIGEHYVSEEMRPTAEAIADALRTVDLKDLTTRHLDGRSMEGGQPSRTLIDLDEDLPCP